MLNEGHGATRAAVAVGYESASHFTRDYARLFGTASSRDMEGGVGGGVRGVGGQTRAVFVTPLRMS